MAFRSGDFRGVSYLLVEKLNGSFSWTSNAAARIRPSFNAAARACSSTSPPLAVFIKNAPTKYTILTIRNTDSQQMLDNKSHSTKSVIYTLKHCKPTVICKYDIIVQFSSIPSSVLNIYFYQSMQINIKAMFEDLDKSCYC